jgi:nicotinamidase-related amidase
MAYTLICVDVQPKFPVKPEQDFVPNVCREVALAMERQANIIFLEYENFGETLPEVKQLVNQNRYQRIYYGVKKERDGSVWVRKAVQERAFFSEWFVFVGAYTGQCVYETVKGINSWFPRSRIEVVADACRDTGNSWHTNGLKELKKLNNVVILNEV